MKNKMIVKFFFRRMYKENIFHFVKLLHNLHLSSDLHSDSGIELVREELL